MNGVLWGSDPSLLSQSEPSTAKFNVKEASDSVTETINNEILHCQNEENSVDTVEVQQCSKAETPVEGGKQPSPTVPSQKQS